MHKQVQGMLKYRLKDFLKSLPIARKGCYVGVREGRIMTMHFPKVPVGLGPYQALLQPQSPLRPLVLVVDDEPVITDTLSAILNGVGFAALTACDAISALETALLIPPQVLITDLAMPGMDGLELGVAVSRAVPDCEVILFSGHASICDVSTRMRAMACDFPTLLKPVHPADMIDCICERLEKRGCPEIPHRVCRVPSFDDLMWPGRQSSRDPHASVWSFSVRQRFQSPGTALA